MPKKTDYTPEELDDFVTRAQQGDTDAFSELYHAFVDKIYRYVYYRVKHEDAMDLTEAIFLRVWEHIGSYKTGRNYFSSWIYRIAHNMVVDHYRMTRENVSLEYDLPDEKRESDPVDMTEQSLSHEALQLAIAKLKKKYQEVIVLYYINGLDNREIARIMSRTEGNLRILKFRALRSLRKVLEEMNIRY